MDLRLVFVSAACLSIFMAPASGTSLFAAAAAVKGAIFGAGLAALKTSGGSETLIIQSQPGSVAELVPANQVIVQDPVFVHNAHIVTYTSSNLLSRLWGAVSSIIAAKTKAISALFRPNRVVVILPHTTTEKPTTTHKPTQKPVITIDFENKPLVLPSIDIEVGHKPPVLPSIDIEVGHKPPVLPSIDIEVGHKPPVLPSINIEVDHKPLVLPSIDIEVDHKPLVLPSVELSASVGRRMFQRVQPVAVINYVDK